MKHLVLATVAALVLAPGLALAQSGSTSEAPKASDLKGPPNAAGYGTDTGMDKGSTVVGGAGSSEQAPSAKNLKGSPNANGYKN